MIFKPNEIVSETKLTADEVMHIAMQYVENKNGEYEIYSKNILYDDDSYITHTAVWYVDIISVIVKKTWPDACETLAISDESGKVCYVSNDHGVVVEKYC